MKNFEYIYPKTVESIPAILSATKGQSLLFAGGTDAFARIKEGVDSPEQLVNLKSVKDLTKIGGIFQVNLTKKLCNKVRTTFYLDTKSEWIQLDVFMEKLL